jgi:3-phosphoshikimate 1-carboxyvinyltransferase
VIAEVCAPAAGPLAGTVLAPPSKNYTTRYVLASALAKGHSTVLRPAVQDDAIALVGCLRRLGAQIEASGADGEPIEFVLENDGKVARLDIHGFGDSPKLDSQAPLDPENAGAVLRMLMGVCAVLPEVRFETSHADSLGKRPNRDLLDAFAQLGIEIECESETGCLPITMRGGIAKIRANIARRREAEGIPADGAVTVVVSGGVSSQFCSALMFLAPMLDENIIVEVTGKLRSRPLIATTRGVLARAGVIVESSTTDRIHLIRAGQKFATNRWDANGDWPGSAAILAAAAAVPGSTIRVRGLHADDQGEQLCLDYYRAAGHDVPWAPDAGAAADLVFTHAEGVPRAAAINGDLCTDAVLAMMSAAVVANGASRFVGIRNLQFKECDRVREPLAELAAVYATALPGEDGALPNIAKSLWFEPTDDPDTIHITGWPAGFAGGIEVDGRGDHRVIMMLSVVALACRDGLRIRGAEHVSKSFPGWFDTLRALGARVEFHR